MEKMTVKRPDRKSFREFYSNVDARQPMTFVDAKGRAFVGHLSLKPNSHSSVWAPADKQYFSLRINGRKTLKRVFLSDVRSLTGIRDPRTLADMMGDFFRSQGWDTTHWDAETQRAQRGA